MYYAQLPSFQGWASGTNTGWLEAGVDAYRASLLDPSAGPTNVTTVRFDPWGRVVGRKAWTISYSGSPSSASATFEQSQQYVYDAAGLLIRLHHDAAAANGDFQTRFVTDSGRSPAKRISCDSRVKTKPAVAAIEAADNARPDHAHRHIQQIRHCEIVIGGR